MPELARAREPPRDDCAISGQHHVVRAAERDGVDAFEIVPRVQEKAFYPTDIQGFIVQIQLRWHRARFERTVANLPVETAPEG